MIFRAELLNNGSQFMEVFFEVGKNAKKLPGNSLIRARLKTFSVQIFHNWFKKYSTNYLYIRQMNIILLNSKKLNYDAIVRQDIPNQQRKENIVMKRKLLEKRTVHLLVEKFNNINSDGLQQVSEINVLMNMLVPNFTEGTSILDKCGSTPSTSNAVIVELDELNPEITVNHENDVIVYSFLEKKRTLEKYLNIIKRIQSKAPFVNLNDFTERIENLRATLQLTISKAKELRIKNHKRYMLKYSNNIDDDDDDDQDFIDVQEILPDDILMMQYTEDKEKIEDIDSNVEGTSSSPLKNEPKAIPTVPFGLDLMYWGEDRKNVQIPQNDSDCHRFWKVRDDDNSVMIASEDIYSQRIITYVGEERKSNKICRVKLSNGKLCPRRDFHKCPLHGEIVDRDDNGDPLVEGSSINKQSQKLSTDDINNKEFEKNYRKSVLDNGFQTNEKKRKNEDFISESDKTRDRLKKKLFDPKAIKRVSQVLDDTRKKRLQKKFGDQFSHL